jgi:hypothetical protein
MSEALIEAVSIGAWSLGGAGLAGEEPTILVASWAMAAVSCSWERSRASIRTSFGGSKGLFCRSVTGGMPLPLESPDMFSAGKRFSRVVALLIAIRMVRIFSIHAIGNNSEAAMV